MPKQAIAVMCVAVGVRAIVSLLMLTRGLGGIPFSALSTWNDFGAAYQYWLMLVHQGYLPYRDFFTYKYPPLFLYSLYPFFTVSHDAAAIPIVASDAATAVAIYFVARRYASPNIALAAGLLYSLSPFVLYYEDFLWLSSQPMTLFVVLSIYFLSSDRPVLSSLLLAVATMFKQEALFILPAYLVIVARSGRRAVVASLLVFVAFCLIVSVPWLLLAPKDYFYSLSYYPLSNIFGPGEPSLIASSPAAAGHPVASGFSPQACGISTIPGVFTGSLCGTIVNLQAFEASLIVGKMNQIAFFLSPLLLILFAPALYVVRRAPNIVTLLSTYSLLASFVLFSQFLEPSLGYYFVLAYALIFASISNGKTLVMGGVSAAVSIFVPEGPYQVILPLAFLFAAIILYDRGNPGLRRGRTAIRTPEDKPLRAIHRFGMHNLFITNSPEKAKVSVNWNGPRKLSD